MLHEEWKDYTEEEINAVKEKKCKKCKYATYGNRRDNDAVVWYTCDYYITTGTRRGVRPEECQYYKR